MRLHRTATKRLHNSVVGDIKLTGDALEVPGEGLTLIAYTAAAGSAAEEQLKLLASWRRTVADAPSGQRTVVLGQEMPVL